MEILNKRYIMERRFLWSVERWILSGALLFLSAIAAPIVDSSCYIETNTTETTLVCNHPASLFSFNGSTANITLVEMRCIAPPAAKAPTTPPRLEFSRMKTLKISNCGIETVKWLRGVRHVSGHLQKLDLSDNLIDEMEWQLVKEFQAQKMVVINNPIKCSCTNKWLYTYQKNANPTQNQTMAAAFLQLPSTISLNEHDYVEECNIKCQNESVDLQPPMINTTLSSTATITCQMHGSFVGDFQPEDLFRWPSSNEKAHTERKQRWKVTKEGANTYRMNIWNLTGDDLGAVVCECLECRTPLVAYSEFRFNTPITLKMESFEEHNELIVHGYPLRNLTMTLRRLSDNQTETRELAVSKKDRVAKTISFFDKLITVKYNPDLSFVSNKIYSFDLAQNAQADNYTVTVCMLKTNNCAEFETPLEHFTHFPVFNESDSKQSGSFNFAYFFFVVLVVIALGALLLSVFHYYRRDRTASKLANAVSWHKKRGFRRISRNTNTTEATSLRMDDSLSATMSNYSLQHVPVIDKDSLTLEDKIGKGAFGEVFIGEWKTKGVRVAVKILHGVQVDAQMDKEAAMLAALDHDNVVKMFGVCKAAEQQSLYLVLELMNLGDLKSYIKAREPQCANYSQFPPSLLPTELVNIAQQVCTGLSYIHMQQIVHRDLAARNCLVSGETDMRVCNPAFRPPVSVKISDFGMSRRLYSQAEYYKMGDKKTALPVRWLPPECLESGRFTYQSDMWAFGVTLYELFTFGAMPYGDLSNNEALMAVISGMRPTVPPKCPPEIAAIMTDCWKAAPDERPAADDALIRLKMIQ